MKVAAHTSPRGFSSDSLYACLWIRWQEEVNNPFRFVLSHIPRHCKSLSHAGPLFLPQLSSIFSFSFSAKTTLGSKTYLNLLYQVCLAQFWFFCCSEFSNLTNAEWKPTCAIPLWLIHGASSCPSSAWCSKYTLIILIFLSIYICLTW